MLSIVFFFNDTPTTKIYTLSLHDALPIYCVSLFGLCGGLIGGSLFEFEYCDESGDFGTWIFFSGFYLDRKSTRLNSSHVRISYAVFCLKKKNKNNFL